ncbi:LytR C-terminal domain-containing protein [Propionibacteriaceae bacterium Y1685]|uniref:LytR C-terminal domain-containing protein n=1 Tax=Microlunatus sp. Y1700 TaxID=3418487 RepID=UPI003B7C76FC
MTQDHPQSGITGAAVWRAVRTPLTLLFLLAILAFGAKWGYDNATAPPPPPPPTPCVEQPVQDGKLTSEQVSVNVYNGGKKRGLAGDVAHVLREKGFKILNSGNADAPVAETVVVGAAEDNPEVKLVMGFFKDAKFQADGRIERDVDVLLGEKYAGMNGKAATSIKLDAKSVCLAPLPSPSLGE